MQFSYQTFKVLIDIFAFIVTPGPSQWPYGLRHELSSRAQIVVAWVRAPVEAWMFALLSSIGSGSNSSSISSKT
jgi:hypothetical protein